MGEPALLIEDGVAEEAAGQQATRFIVINGEKTAAAEGAGTAAVETGVAEGTGALATETTATAVATEGGLGSGLLTVGEAVAAPLAVLLILFYPSSIGPEIDPSRYRTQSMGPPTAPAPTPVQVCDGTSNEELLPILPGQTCSAERRTTLESEKDALQKSMPKHKFDTGNIGKQVKLPCSYLSDYVEHIKKLIAKRNQIQAECFIGRPEPGHEEAVSQLEKSLQKYTKLRDINCAPGHPMATK